ncbi:MAG: LLM class flavin-dependent oxidoreductase, partial [Actinobacteria bacterium]|nr:LLM class flavin-dependent oxidoreductase [Actinomycetota bacterium]
MEISMTMPTMVPHDRADTLAWCRAVDDGPWASLAIPERITYPSHAWTVELAAAAALTERVRLWTTIIVLPAHDAVDVAKQLASVDRLSDGRLTVGVGVGGREHDYRAIGGSFERRWSRMDQQVATMRRI